MSKDTTADCLSYQLWWMIFIPIHSSLHFQLGRSILIQFLWPITCQPSATRLLHPLAMIPWRCSTQCLQPHQCLQLTTANTNTPVIKLRGPQGQWRRHPIIGNSKQIQRGGRRLVKGKKRGTGALLNFCLLLYLGRAEQQHTPTTNRG